MALEIAVTFIHNFIEPGADCSSRFVYTLRASIRGLGRRQLKDDDPSRALGGTLHGDPCSLLGVIWVLPGYIRSLLGVPPKVP